MIKRIIKYLLFLVLAVIVFMIAAMLFPKGSLEDQLVKAKVPALGYVVIEEGKIIESRVIGELESGVPAPRDAIFNVASVTKPVFATMVMQLIQNEFIGLDEPLFPYWVDPDIASDPRHKLLTPRFILSHRSGFPNWRWHTENGKLGFWHEPGTTYQYSGEGMEYLKKAIENKSNKSLITLMDSLIFNPLIMNSSRLIWDSSQHETRLAKYHNREGELYEIKKRTNPVASDDLCTTIDDLTKFALHIMDNQGGLNDNYFNQMVTINTRINKRYGFGLGWEVVPDLPNGEYAMVHGGSDQGVKARILILPKSKSAFIAFANGDNGQPIIDRLMVNRLKYGDTIISKMYAPIIWRIIYLPFRLPF